MKKELEEKLFNKYPRLFQGKDKDITENLMPFGFECSDGWYKLINSLCHCIEEHYWNQYNNKSKEYVDFEDWKQNKIENEYPIVVQVKEKFGGLRFYMSSYDEGVDGLIRMAEEISTQTCEYCGNTGKLNNGPWIKTLCDKCGKNNENV